MIAYSFRCYDLIVIALQEIQDISDDTLKAIIEKNPELEHLNLNRCPNIRGRCLEEPLPNLKLRKLGLRRCQLDDQAAYAVAKIIESNTLSTLNLRGNNISDKGAVAIAQALQSNQSIRAINLSENPIMEEGIIALLAAFHENKTLKMLYFFTDSEFNSTVFSSLLNNDPGLTELELKGKSLTSIEIYALAVALGRNTYVEKLTIANNAIGSR